MSDQEARAIPFVESGNAHLAANRVSEAIAAYRNAIAIAPDFALARRNYARALVSGGYFDEGERLIRAELVRENRSDLHHVLGTSLYLQHRYEEAIDAFDAALLLAPDALPTRHNRAMALAKCGHTTAAIAEYDAVFHKGHSTPDLFLNWFAALHAQGEEGEDILRQGLRRFPAELRLHRHLAEVRWARGEPPDQFASHIREALATASVSAPLRGLYADTLIRAGAYEGAEKALREELTLNPLHRGLLVQLATLLVATDRDSEAVTLLAPLLAAGADVEVLTQAGVALLRVGRSNEAREVLGRARNAAPLSQIVLAHTASVARVLGDPEYERLYDYGRFVRVIDIQPPAGFSSVEAFNESLAMSLDRLHRAAQHPIGQTARGGTQTDGDLRESADPMVKAFLAQALAATVDFANSLPSDANHPFLAFAGRPLKFSGAWSIRLRAGGHHVNHVHTGGWISSAYYVRLPSIGAATGRAGWLKFGEPLRPVVGCTPAHWVEPKVGRLALFPSYMWHGVETFETEGDRLTIAFDIVPV